MSNPVVNKIEAELKTEATKPITVPLWVYVGSVVVAFLLGAILL